MRFKDKVILITDSNRDLAKVMAEGFYEERSNAIVCICKLAACQGAVGKLGLGVVRR